MYCSNPSFADYFSLGEKLTIPEAKLRYKAFMGKYKFNHHALESLLEETNRLHKELEHKTPRAKKGQQLLDILAMNGIPHY